MTSKYIFSQRYVVWMYGLLKLKHNKHKNNIKMKVGLLYIGN